MDVERAIEHLLELHAAAVTRMDRAEARLDKLEVRSERLEKEVRAMLRVGAKFIVQFTKAQRRNEERFTRIDERFTRIDERFTRIEGTLGQMNKKLDRLIDVIVKQGRNGRGKLS